MNSKRAVRLVGVLLLWAGAGHAADRGKTVQQALDAAQAAAAVIGTLSPHTQVRDALFQSLEANPRGVEVVRMPNLHYTSGGYYNYSGMPALRFRFQDAVGGVLTPFGTRAVVTGADPRALKDVSSVQLEMNRRVGGQKLRFHLRSRGVSMPLSGERMVFDGEGTLRGPTGLISLQVQGVCLEGWVREGTLLGTGEGMEFAIYFWDGGADGVVSLRTGEIVEIRFDNNGYENI